MADIDTLHQGTATEQELALLHRALATKLTDAILNGEQMVNKEGEVVRVPASASLLNVARQMLKDNKIESKVVPKSPLGNLSAALDKAFSDLDDED